MTDVLPVLPLAVPPPPTDGSPPGPTTGPTTGPPSSPPRPPRSAVQRSFDDLGVPLIDVTFCVIDLETTGGSPADCAITEVGAVKIKGGECLGTFHTLVNPGLAIPPNITVITGITEAMVLPAPRIAEVLPSLQEFIRGSVICGHNIRFDVSFLDAALVREGRPKLANRVIDTLGMARRLVRDEVPNLRLQTLADRFRLPHRPTHRALDDALATADLLHILLERAGSLGVTGLDDLLALPTMSGHAQAGKLALTQRLPRSPGVYLFRDRHGRVLYVGKATNLRARVRSYFSSDDRRKIGQLLRETVTVDHWVCATSLEAAVLEVRLIHDLLPRFNRQAKTWSRSCYVKLTTSEPFPRLSIARSARADGALYVGPLGSSTAAQLVIDAVHTALPLRRCTAKLSRDPAKVVCRDAPCAPAQLGVATCPCAGAIDGEAYGSIVEQAILGLTTHPEILFAPLRRRLGALAEAERFEEAAATRDRAAALASALRRQRRFDQLRRSGRLVLGVPGAGLVELHGGHLVGVAPEPPPPSEVGDQLVFDGDTDPSGLAGLRPWAPVLTGTTAALHDLDGRFDTHLPVRRDAADELLAVASWLDRNQRRIRLAACEGTWSSALPLLPTFQPPPVRSPG